MIRTQVYLPKALYNHIQLVAKQAHKPAAAVVRQLLAGGLAKHTNEHNMGEALLKLAEIGGKGPADLSSNIDKYLYQHT